MCTDEFEFVIALCTGQAPISCAYVLSDADAGAFDGSSIFRIVNLPNQSASAACKIEVIQMGWPAPTVALAPSIAHESTRTTGLRHRRGTVSLARFAPGAVYHSFFVCMRDEPGLDEGGLRHPDGLGFAAFGFIAAGFEHLEKFFEANASQPEFLEQPTPLRTVRRVPSA